MKSIVFCIVFVSVCAVAHAQDLQKISHPAYDNQRKEDGFRAHVDPFQYNEIPCATKAPQPAPARKLTDSKVERANLDDHTITIDPRQYNLDNIPRRMYGLWRRDYRREWMPLKKM